jgi:hypothetical protein
MKQEITPEIKDALTKEFFYQDDGKTKVSLGNCRLDFKKDYFFEKFTEKGVKLFWMNGQTKVPVIGKVEYNEEHDDYAFFTEGWSYIEHFKLKGGTNNGGR